MDHVQILKQIRDNAHMAHERGEPHLMIRGYTACAIAQGLIRQGELELVDDRANSEHQILVRWKGENQKE